MTVHYLRDRSPDSIVGHYVTNRKGPISTVAATRAIRTVLSDCALSNEELISVIVLHASAIGVPIEFDGAASQVNPT